jgi:hypothetical protein
LITLRHWPIASAQSDRRLGERALRHDQPGQASQHARRFALWNAIAVVERVRGGLRARPQLTLN